MIQLTEQDVRRIAQEELDNREKTNAFGFGTALIPYHEHTGVDSPQIDTQNIIGAGLTRVASSTTTATPTPNVSNVDLFEITGATGSIAFQNPVGNSINGKLLRIRITSSNSATARAITWTSSTGGYIGNSPALPSATTTGKTSNLGFEYDTNNSLNNWRLLWSANS